MDYRQRTLKSEVSCTGIGLHSGNKAAMTLKPAPPDTGIRFIRRDLPEQPEIHAVNGNVTDTNMSTSVGSNGMGVSTVEHLTAAFFGLGIDNVRVELDGPEVPIMDGSAAPFVFLINSAGFRTQKSPKQFLVVKKRFRVEDGHRSITIHPSRELKITYTIDFNHPLIKNQRYFLRFSGGDFIREISRARTFGFLKDIHLLRENGLAMGGSLNNAIVIDDFRVLNEDGLRYPDEFVRHKILDFIGDLALLGKPVIGHFVVEKSGHFLNQVMLRELVHSEKYWRVCSFKDPEEAAENRLRIPVFGTLEGAQA
ncbi:MAG: UDP-3-O-acyl-N-acetylglucosamine deacetylase [Thermodesulfobacteriota bacterium]